MIQTLISVAPPWQARTRAILPALCPATGARLRAGQLDNELQELDRLQLMLVRQSEILL